MRNRHISSFQDLFFFSNAKKRKTNKKEKEEEKEKRKKTKKTKYICDLSQFVRSPTAHPNSVSYLTHTYSPTPTVNAPSSPSFVFIESTCVWKREEE